MASSGCVEFDKTFLQSKALELVMSNGFLETNQKTCPSIQLSISKDDFEKFINEFKEDDATPISITSREWTFFKTFHGKLFFDQDEDAMRSDFIRSVEDYKALCQKDRWMSECQCSQCRDVQEAVVEQSYHIKHGTLDGYGEDVNIEVSKRDMEIIYFEKHNKNYDWDDDTAIQRAPTYGFSDRQWSALIDKWEDFKEEWKYHLFRYHCDARYGLIDTMWSTIGIPVQVIFEGGFRDIQIFDIRMDTLKNVEIDDIRDKVWRKLGRRLERNGWRKEEIFFKEFSGAIQYPLQIPDGNFVEDDDLHYIFMENPNLLIQMVNLYLSDEEDEEEEDEEEEEEEQEEDEEDEEDEEEEDEEEENADTEQDGGPVSLLVRWMFEPYITRGQDEWNTNTITAFKRNFIYINGLDLEPDDLRVVFQDRDLEDHERWCRLGFSNGNVPAIQVFIRGRGGGKRKFEDVMEEVNDKVVKIASKMSADNQFKPELDELFRKLESNTSGTPIADIVRNMNPDEFQSLYGNYWNDTQANFLRFVPNIAENLTPLMNKIVKTEKDASDARQALCATLCGFFAKEFSDGKQVKNSMFEKLLEDVERKHEEDERIEARVQQLILERQNASSGGDTQMTG